MNSILFEQIILKERRSMLETPHLCDELSSECLKWAVYFPGSLLRLMRDCVTKEQNTCTETGSKKETAPYRVCYSTCSTDGCNAAPQTRLSPSLSLLCGLITLVLALTSQWWGPHINPLPCHRHTTKIKRKRINKSTVLAPRWCTIEKSNIDPPLGL